MHAPPALTRSHWEPRLPLLHGRIAWLCLACFLWVRIPSPQSAGLDAGAFPQPPISKPARWTNSIGMVFASVNQAAPLFSIWETRVQDFDAFARATHYSANDGIMALPRGSNPRRGWNQPGFPQNPLHPVVMVSWEDAREFCQWLTKKEVAEGKIGASNRYRLPTDAEWSQAAGNGFFPWSDVFPPTPVQAAGMLKNATRDERHLLPPPKGAGNYAGIEVSGNEESGYRYLRSYNDGFPRTAPAGSFAPNASGLYDMGGNVWEWCQDWYHKDLIKKDLELKLPYTNNDGGGRSYRVLRGASWLDSNAAVLLSDCRFFEFPDHRGDTIGFRIVLENVTF